jgi:hypothetical protein
MSSLEPQVRGLSITSVAMLALTVAAFLFLYALGLRKCPKASSLLPMEVKTLGGTTS